ncbi:MAG: multiheme c-type cytochrome [Usitatibacteraceae bacterium]
MKRWMMWWSTLQTASKYGLWVLVFSAPLAALHAEAQQLPYQSPNETLGTVTCASSLCHGSVKVWKDANVLQNEYLTWSRVDKHARAYNILLNQRSQRIAKNLGLKQPAHETKICLDCHAHVIPAERSGERFKITDGVTCEACHGPAQKWVKTHVEVDNVTAVQHDKNLEAGMYPTSDAAARAKLCMSCHYGNQDKLVTHRIMGAGHPRMSFELDTFTEIAPKHFVVDKDYSERKKVWDGAKTWAIGQALAVAETMSILADPKRGRDGVFPELVLFDCHACHHQMSENRWKPKTAFGPSISPGLVRLNDSSMMMLRAITRALNPQLGDRVSAQTLKLHRAIAGEGDAFAEAAALKKLAQETVPVMSAATFSNQTMGAVLSRLIEDGIQGTYSDYAAAEQATLAIGSIGSYLAKQGAMAAPQKFNAGLKKLTASLAKDEQYKPKEFEALLKDLRGQTALVATNDSKKTVAAAAAGAKP